MIISLIQAPERDPHILRSLGSGGDFSLLRLDSWARGIYQIKLTDFFFAPHGHHPDPSLSNYPLGVPPLDDLFEVIHFP